MKQLLDPNFGMFKYHEEGRRLWFNSDSLESNREFELVGILLGIAIYNSIIVDFVMPKVRVKLCAGPYALTYIMHAYIHKLVLLIYSLCILPLSNLLANRIYRTTCCLSCTVIMDISIYTRSYEAGKAPSRTCPN